MKLLHKESGEFKEAVIGLVQDGDWKIIAENKNFEFDWNTEKKYIVYKISLKSDDEILGLVSIEDVFKEFRLFIRLIEVGRTNREKNKVYDHIAGCLLAFTCDLAFKRNYDGFVSLISKTEIIDLYVNKYGFKKIGNHLVVELESSENLINKYLSNG